MKKILKTTITGLVLIGLTVPLWGCAPGQESSQTQESETTTVQRGDLTVEITAVGNLDLSLQEDLAVDIFYAEATLEEVLVETGDTVEEGDILAKLDEDEWDDELKTLEDAVTTAERAVTTKERALTTAERAVYTKELAVTQAEINLQTAENSLKSNSEIKKAYDAIDDIKYDIRVASELGQYYKIEGLNNELRAAQEYLAELLTASSASTSDAAALALAQAIQTFDEKQKLLEDARIAVDDAQVAVDDAQVAVEDAQEDLAEAQEDLDEANAKSPLITAPFDGFVTKVNVEGGDELMKGTVAVQIADPDQFEADILVSEMDIMQVEMGGTAWVAIDALDGLSLPAEVTHISPTATISAGVVNYTVKVEILSSENFTQERQEAMQEARQKAMEEISSGEMPEPMKQAIEEGRITQEQAEEFMERMQSGEMLFGEGGQTPPATESRQLPTVVPEDFQLREGLTVTVSIIVDSRTNVLLVPNAAITTRGLQSFAQVVSTDNATGERITEERAIEIGITDYQFTEVTSGLSEDEEILVPQGTATTVTTTQQDRPLRIMIPGGGRR